MLLLFALFILFRSWIHLPFTDNGYPEGFFPSEEEYNEKARVNYIKHIKDSMYDIYLLDITFFSKNDYKDMEESYLSGHNCLAGKEPKEKYSYFNFYSDFKDGALVNNGEIIRIIDLSENEKFNERFLPIWICEEEKNNMRFLYVYYDLSTSISVKDLIPLTLINAEN